MKKVLSFLAVALLYTQAFAQTVEGRSFAFEIEL
jgi:hypothetical protein